MLGGNATNDWWSSGSVLYNSEGVFLKKLQIPVIIRGVRSAVDWNYDSELFQVHQILWPEIEMLGLPSLAQYDVVSSSFVREIWKLGGDISAMVPPKVLELMQESRWCDGRI